MVRQEREDISLHRARLLSVTVSFAVLLLFAPLFAQSSSPFDPSTADGSSTASRHAPIRNLKHLLDGTTTSDNWSGYAVTAANDTVTSVKGSWIVPSAICKSPGPKTGYASFWVGIDGYTSDSVEQTGTDSDCSSGTPVYYAWYEFYPEPSRNISMTIAPGDVMSASVTYSGSEFTVVIENQTTGKSFTKSARVAAAKRSSAEWIAEAPSSGTGILPLSDFGTVFFGQDETGISGTCYATISSKTNPIGGFSSSSVFAITMVSSGGSTEAVPSSLSSDGTSFSDEWF
jgi:hypothetical protein